MKTIFIFDQCGESAIKFFIKEGDYSHLDDKYIGSCGDDEFLDELNSIQELDWLDSFPVDSFEKGDKVVVIGFIP